MTSKQERCARWCWAYVTKYPNLRGIEILRAQLDYDAPMIARALSDLVVGGQLCRILDNKRGGYVYTALVPFVVQAPKWVARMKADTVALIVLLAVLIILVLWAPLLAR